LHRTGRRPTTHFPASLPLGALGLAGTWTDHAQEATAGEVELAQERNGLSRADLSGRRVAA
jgi:hypothetical protein